MGKVNVYLPAELEEAVRASGVPISTICQSALREAVKMKCDHPVIIRNGDETYRCERCHRKIELRKQR